METPVNAIIIKSANSAVRTIQRKDGTKVQFNEQTAAIESGGDFPRPFRFTLDENQAPYPQGHYSLDASSFEVGDFDSLRVARRIVLIPMPAAPAK
jgi:hypothetical protein